LWCAWGVSLRLSSMALAVAIASEMEAYEFIETWVFQASRECGGMGYLNIGTRGVCVAASTTGVGGMRSGIEILPSTPARSRHDMGIVWVGYDWAVRPWGSQIAR
jgi:hypothetical protein